MRVRKGDYSPILPSRIDHLAQKSAAQEVDPSRSENKIILATLSASLRRHGPNTAFVSPFPKRERALSAIGNKRGSTQNKIFPVTRECDAGPQLCIAGSASITGL